MKSLKTTWFGEVAAGGQGGLYIPSSNIYFGGSKTPLNSWKSGGASSHLRLNNIWIIKPIKIK